MLTFHIRLLHLNSMTFHDLFMTKSWKPHYYRIYFFLGLNFAIKFPFKRKLQLFQNSILQHLKTFLYLESENMISWLCQLGYRNRVIWKLMKKPFTPFWHLCTMTMHWDFQVWGFLQCSCIWVIKRGIIQSTVNYEIKMQHKVSTSTFTLLQLCMMSTSIHSLQYLHHKLSTFPSAHIAHMNRERKQVLETLFITKHFHHRKFPLIPMKSHKLL